MSNPSVTASITVDDKASPRLRELVELSQRLNRVAKDALNDVGGNRYASNLSRATIAAREHLTVMERLHKVQSAVAATVVGVAGAKAFQIAKHAVADYLPYERGVRYQKAIQGYSDTDMALLERQRVNAATVYGLKPEDTLSAQQAFVTRAFNAQITEAGTKQAIILSKALAVPAEQAAKIVEGLTFGQGIHLHNAADARREIARSTDVAAIAAKSGSMTPEDISQFAKFGIGMSTAAGIKADQAFAAAMTLRRANVGGDESGVFMRQLSARLLAPTKQAFEAFAHMGIDYSQYATQGSVSPDAIDASLRRRYGKGLGEAGKVSLSEAFNDESRNVLGRREDFAAAVREAVEKSGEKLSRTDEKHLVDTALRQYDLAKGGLRGGDLFNDILSKATPKDLQALVGDKQGGRAVMLLNALDQYREYLEKLGHGDGYAEKIANERMEGLAAAVDRLTASMDTASKQIVAANDGWLSPLANAAGKTVAAFTSLSNETKQALSLTAGVASVAGLSTAAVTVLRVINSMGSLATSANLAAVSLDKIAARGLTGAPGIVPGAAPAAEGASRARAGVAERAAPLASRAAPIALTAASVLSKTAWWATVAMLAFDGMNAISGADPNKDADANYTRWKERHGDDAKDKYRALTGFTNAWAQPEAVKPFVSQSKLDELGWPTRRYNEWSELEDAAADQSNQGDAWTAKRGTTRRYLRELGLLDDEPTGREAGSRDGWQSSARANVAPVNEADKWGDGKPAREISVSSKEISVSGTVEGSAEIHQNIALELRPTPYFEGLIKRAEAVANMGINGRLGTGMQGPGDNGTTPSKPPPTGGQ
jgi:hypothetical protein